MQYDNLLTQIDDRVLTITINRPDKLNALNRQTLEELRWAFDEAGRDEAVRAIILTGAGEKAFVAGADIGEIREQTPVQARQFSRRGQQLMLGIEQTEKPVIAAINGFCLGGGMELALACHLRLAADSARLGLPEINLGIMPGFGGTQRLVRLVGATPTLEMTLTGDPIPASRGVELGLINRVLPAAELAGAASDLAGRLAGCAPEAVRGILQSVLQGGQADLPTGLELETARFALCCATEDMREGTSAFLEKRKPAFTGD